MHNNGTTVQSVAQRCRQHVPGVLVVDDGSTDADVAQLFAGTDITVLSHETNQGKGAALRTAVSYLQDQGAAWMITIDGDGQHDPEDIPLFLEALAAHPDSILVGARDFTSDSIPSGSRFGRKFSNMWIRLESGASVSDSQSGFRAYPLKHLTRMPLRGDRYEFEVEILTRAVWHGLTLIDVPIHVWYPDKTEERTTSFRAWQDNARISLTHARLVGRRLLPLPHRQIVKKPADTITPKQLLTHPRKTIMQVLKDSTTPQELAMAAVVGTLLAVLPLIGCHTIAILYFARRLRLNLVMALNIQHLYMPPVVPLACIEIGHYIRHRSWLVPESMQRAVADIPHYLLYWLIGSLILAIKAEDFQHHRWVLESINGDPLIRRLSIRARFPSSGFGEQMHGVGEPRLQPVQRHSRAA